MDTLAERFYSKVGPIDPETGCQEWQAFKDSTGYGRFSVGTRPGGGGLMDKAHRVAWMFSHGVPVPDHLEVRHLCDNPSCVNPWHLLVGTHAENMLDKTYPKVI